MKKESSAHISKRKEKQKKVSKTKTEINEDGTK